MQVESPLRHVKSSVKRKGTSRPLPVQRNLLTSRIAADRFQSRPSQVGLRCIVMEAVGDFTSEPTINSLSYKVVLALVLVVFVSRRGEQPPRSV